MICTCVRCGKSFESSRKTSVCENCKIQTCVICGTSFELQWPYTQKTCSSTCRGEYRKISGISKQAAEKSKQTKIDRYGTTSNVKLIKKICKYCGKEFETTSNRRVYCYDKHYGPCPVCGKLVEIHDMAKGPSACSTECRQKLIERTNLEKYGTACVFQNDDVKEKIKETNVRKYGVDHYSKTDEYRMKFTDTSLSRYGTVHPMMNKELQEKKVKTTERLYGGNSPTCNPVVAEKSKASLLDRYGGSGLSSPILKEKIQTTNIEKYGFVTPSKSEIVQKHIKETLQQRYGGSYQSTVEGMSRCISDKTRVQNYLEFKRSPSEYIESHYKEKPLVSRLCKDLGVTDTPIYDALILDNCKQLVERKSSNMEDEIITYLKLLSTDIKIIHNSKKEITPLELDIYLPKYKFAIECNPTITHNSSFKDPWGQNPKQYMYHKQKSDMCEEKGIQLFHIFGYEWTYKKEIIKSMIANDLGFTSNRLYARNTEVCEITSDECKEFLNKNHRQGNTFASIRLGLKDKKTNELVSVMTFNKIRSTIGKTDKFEGFELSRFCSKINTSVVGGASKLFKYFLNNSPGIDIVSFSDKAHTSGKLYQVLGFHKVNESTPSYVWVNMKDDSYYTRVNCQKRNLRRLFNDPNIDIDTMTERQIMESHGYAQVFDSGVIRWEYVHNNHNLV